MNRGYGRQSRLIAPMDLPGDDEAPAEPMKFTTLGGQSLFISSQMTVLSLEGIEGGTRMIGMLQWSADSPTFEYQIKESPETVLEMLREERLRAKKERKKLVQKYMRRRMRRAGLEMKGVRRAAYGGGSVHQMLGFPMGMDVDEDIQVEDCESFDAELEDELDDAEIEIAGDPPDDE